MPALASHSHFSLTFADSSHALQVLAFSGEEAISRPFTFDVELVSERSNLPLEQLLHQRAFLAFDTRGAGIHGQVFQVRQGESGTRLSRYHLRLVPHLAYLALRRNHRIFQQRTVPQIVAQVLAEHGILGDICRFQINDPLPPREYCVQYAESDLAFIQRLCAEDGIHYHFEHSPQDHVLVFADHQATFQILDCQAPYQQDSGMLASAPVVRRFGLSLSASSSRTSRRDYAFAKAGLSLETQAQGDREVVEPDLEDYTYPGGFEGEQLGKPLSQRALQALRIAHCRAEGESDQPALRSGHLLRLSQHPRTEWNDLWLLTGVRHEGKQPQVLEEHGDDDGGDGFRQGYRNHFTATPWDVFFRPPLAPAQRILASQTARVTGPRGEEVHCDEWGRVKVRFHWDREGQDDEFSSCWLRVASNWAGQGYGAVTLPRVGMEVLVVFIEGDPARPLISGCLSNNLNPPAYPLPANKTRSVLRSRSTPDNGGYNELHIEDRAGQEEIYLRAQRDLVQKIKRDSRLDVGGERHALITGNNIAVLKAEDQRTVTGDRKVRLEADDYLEVAGSVHTRVQQVIVAEAGQQVHLKAGAELVLDGGSTLSLSAGGHHLLIGPGGIFSSTPIQVGGAPVPGLPAAGATAQLLQALPGLALAAQQHIVRQAASRSAAVCAVCALLAERRA